MPGLIQSLLNTAHPPTHQVLSKSPWCLLIPKSQTGSCLVSLCTEPWKWSSSQSWRLERPLEVWGSSSRFSENASHKGEPCLWELKPGQSLETVLSLLVLLSLQTTFKLFVELVSLSEKYKGHSHQTLNFYLPSLSNPSPLSPFPFLPTPFLFLHTHTHSHTPPVSSIVSSPPNYSCILGVLTKSGF